MKKISKIYSNFLFKLENIEPEKQKKIENAMIKGASLVGVLTVLMILKLTK